jgi:hypothetical protein
METQKRFETKLAAHVHQIEMCTRQQKIPHFIPQHEMGPVKGRHQQWSEQQKERKHYHQLCYIRDQRRKGPTIHDSKTSRGGVQTSARQPSLVTLLTTREESQQVDMPKASCVSIMIQSNIRHDRMKNLSVDGKTRMLARSNRDRDKSPCRR